MTRLTHAENTLVISYLSLRKVLGALGILFPFMLWLGGYWVFDSDLQPSLSAYYHSGMRDVFVGVLFAIGFFLYSYKGYDRFDNVVGNLASIFVFGLALFPTASGDVPLEGRILIVHHLHSVFATLFFSCLAIFCLVLFTKSSSAVLTPKKRKRNMIYRICGYTMMVCMLLMLAVMILLDDEAYVSYKPVFWLEAIALIAFGISWSVKGEAILKDE